MQQFKLFVRFTVWAVTALIIGIAATYFYTINAPMSHSVGKFELTIKKGDGPRAVAANLQEIGALTNDRVFLLYVLLSGTRDRFFPGTYEIAQNATIRDVVDVVTAGKDDSITLTALEGWRITDIAKEVAKKTKITEAEFLAAAPVAEYEGYLFPDTYNFRPEVTAGEIVKTMRSNFDSRVAAAGLTLSKNDVILASIVEREAQKDEDRPMVAGVYLNRLAIDMALDADPTIQYAKGDWGPITLAEYRSVISPYNTYLNKGLPPTPIGNPSIASLKSVKSPDEHGYFYFFHTSTGETYFSKTLAEHNSNKVKYLR